MHRTGRQRGRGQKLPCSRAGSALPGELKAPFANTRLLFDCQKIVHREPTQAQPTEPKPQERDLKAENREALAAILKAQREQPAQ